ncbi:OmpA family protein [Mucilaginibacter dorajii]|uniref:OmpA-like domain-containing protein n=1 Tax=Mucilaginibacter dorajii TaxID=692994 RepID=A0ABP7QW41_9SPHI|nr:OmpA family protein [Mucilaginibacter dorajii]MCS3732509.1 outer membrane protein OmpA-like peptidoglycan-associated protein [Mucilaginibacter dorajii]
MKKTLPALLLLFACFTAHAQFGNLLNRAKEKLKTKANAKVDQHLDKATDKVVNTADTILTGTATSGGTGTATSVSNTTTANVSTGATVSAGSSQTMPNFKAFNNYDFMPGDKILFEDHFEDDQNGEFPAHWNLGAGQAVVNNTGDIKSLLLTDGNFAHVSPLIKSPSYLGEAFTIEYDSYFNGGYGPHIYFYGSNADATAAHNDLGNINMAPGSGIEFSSETSKVDLTGKAPESLSGDNAINKWHHIAIAYKKNQLKVYVDQYRILVVPNIGITPHAIDIEGIGNADQPIIIANFRIASGGGMNMLGKKFTDAKIVTHGINFDVDQATIKPESMGTLNMIASVLKDNPEIKFQVGGHTDNSGTPAHNLTLSQQRADAVKTQLISMGIDAARLSTKGFGDTKPISDNVTIEGKANNRRVEFVKL